MEGATPGVELDAAKVDVLEKAATLDPLPLLSAPIRNSLEAGNGVFEDGLKPMNRVNIGGKDRVEYVKLVARQIRAGQLGLARTSIGAGSLFAVGKKGSSKQRAVWNGAGVSARANAPPCPRHLASPTALLALRCGKDQSIYVTKRDGTCWFDQLRLPGDLAKHMGRPVVSLEDLRLHGGLSDVELQLALRCQSDALDGVFVPISLTWPMGFSWSSCVAQDVMLELCRRSGLPSTGILACDARSPSDLSLTHAVATDDVMIFSVGCREAACEAGERLDRTFCDHGVLKNASKDINGEVNVSIVGVDLENGNRLAAPPPRAYCILITLLHVLANPCRTPREVAALLGAMQWIDLLRRPKLSIFDKVYSFTKLINDTTIAEVPDEALMELCVSFLLGAYWEVDLTLDYLPLVSATDASTSFGFGASVAPVPVALVEDLAKLSEKCGGYVKIEGPSDIFKGLPDRFGSKLESGLSFLDFKDVLSLRARHDCHINVLEGEAFILWVRWLLRSRAHHGHRVVALVDSAVWLGAASKGRSSSQLNRLLRRSAALCFAGELLLYVVFVPTAWNPSDGASRGVRKRVRAKY